jgi:hypothetical protein
MHELMLDPEWGGEVMDVTPRCPKCRSVHIESRNMARRLGGAIGAIAGTAGGVILALKTESMSFSKVPVITLLGAAAGVVIEGIVAGATGGVAGSKLGEAIDHNVLHNQHCRDCGHTFSGKS